MNEQTENSEWEAVRKKLADLGLSLDTDRIPYHLEKMFPKLEGWGSKGEIKRKFQLIGKVETLLSNVLLPNEEVFYIAKGVQHSILESMSIGALWSSMINQTVFILTSARLIMVRSNSKGKPAETCWMIYYSEIKKFKATWTGVIDLQLADGKRLKFTGFSKLDKKSMPRIFEETLELFRKHEFAPECSQSREDLCGRCYRLVPKGEFACDSCGTRFWTPKQVALRSLIFPAWGDLLLKHHTLACFEFLGVAFTWFVAVMLALDGKWMEAAFIIFFAHSFDAIVTYFIAKKGLHPAGRAMPTETAADAAY